MAALQRPLGRAGSVAQHFIIQQKTFLSSVNVTVVAEGLSLYMHARHLYICDFHKNLIQSVRNRRKRKGSDDDGDSPVQDIDTPEVDLYQLQVNTLRRYKRHFKLQTRPGLNKAQLVEIIGCHFRTIPVNEKDTLTYFIYSVKNDKNKPDLKMDSGVH
ncbi:PREDICTED: histone deacetylase complex subunit SAP30 [Chaetura pelagica]|uniref:histone deacetylase complex subunit SAP30 n=1 Tax=Chaetura pelagica TaxID=8897 RepID=UPI00052354A3|nr:PREDICTED: histone deacetylase complex subunit SAP30 [Chaetura pelagica]